MGDTKNNDQYMRAAELISQAEGLLITAGAGMGVDSGLPDFRGEDGFWKAYPALKEAGLNFQGIATPDSFLHSPNLAWGFYGHRLNLYRETIPHAGFKILKEFGERMPQGYYVVTSNVDGQFQKAGFSDMKVCEVHGSIHYMQCMEMCAGKIWTANGFKPEVDDARCMLVNPLPRCPVCGSVARPNILMFWDEYWLSQRTSGKYDLVEKSLDRINKLVTIEIGAGDAIATIRRFGEQMHGPLIRINPNDARLPSGKAGVSINAGGLEALSQISLLMKGK